MRAAVLLFGSARWYWRNIPTPPPGSRDCCMYRCARGDSDLPSPGGESPSQIRSADGRSRRVHPGAYGYLRTRLLNRRASRYPHPSPKPPPLPLSSRAGTCVRSRGALRASRAHGSIYLGNARRLRVRTRLNYARADRYAKRVVRVHALRKTGIRGVQWDPRRVVSVVSGKHNRQAGRIPGVAQAPTGC